MDFSEKKKLGYMEGGASVVLNTFLFCLKFYAGATVGSISMIADAWHTLADSVTSLVVLFGFWISGRPADDNHTFGHGRAEAIASVIIGTLLGVVGVSFFKDSVLRLVNRQSVKFSLFCIIVFRISFAGQ